MKMIKYFALVLVMVAGQSMASPVVVIDNGHQGSTLQIQADARHLINAERSLLSALGHFDLAFGQSHLPRSITKLIRRTHGLIKTARHARNGYMMRSQMQRIKYQFRYIRNEIAQTHALQYSRSVRFKVRQVARKVRRLSHSVYSYR